MHTHTHRGAYAWHRCTSSTSSYNTCTHTHTYRGASKCHRRTSSAFCTNIHTCTHAHMHTRTHAHTHTHTEEHMNDTGVRPPLLSYNINTHAHIHRSIRMKQAYVLASSYNMHWHTLHTEEPTDDTGVCLLLLLALTHTHTHRCCRVSTVVTIYLSIDLVSILTSLSLDRETGEEHITVGRTRRKDGGWHTSEESGRVTWTGQEEREAKAEMGGLC